MTFAEAQKASASVCEGGRCGTRFEFMLIQYGREKFETNLDKLLIIIGGDPFRGNWYWTEEEVASSAGYAWVFSGHGGGNLSCSNARCFACLARVFRAL